MTYLGDCLDNGSRSSGHRWIGHNLQLTGDCGWSPERLDSSAHSINLSTFYVEQLPTVRGTRAKAAEICDF
jgi:hypothetical protein